jgi:hypothetical protein
LLLAIPLLLDRGTLMARDASVAVTWRIVPACGANFQSAVLQQDREDQLRAASIAVSRVHIASLVASVDCQPARASLSVQQCFSLSQAVAEPSAANGLHLATMWRNCQAYALQQTELRPARPRGAARLDRPFHFRI